MAEVRQHTYEKQDVLGRSTTYVHEVNVPTPQPQQEPLMYGNNVRYWYDRAISLSQQVGDKNDKVEELLKQIADLKREAPGYAGYSAKYWYDLCNKYAVELDSTKNDGKYHGYTAGYWYEQTVNARKSRDDKQLKISSLHDEVAALKLKLERVQREDPGYNGYSAKFWYERCNKYAGELENLKVELRKFKDERIDSHYQGGDAKFWHTEYKGLSERYYGLLDKVNKVRQTLSN